MKSDSHEIAKNYGMYRDKPLKSDREIKATLEALMEAKPVR